jgi:hypothetical protein
MLQLLALVAQRREPIVAAVRSLELMRELRPAGICASASSATSLP